MSVPKRPLEEAKLPNDEVLEIVTKIFTDPISEKDKVRVYQKEYHMFVESYPTLFEMACKRDFDFKQFEKMLKLKISVDEGKVTQHDASVKLGTQLFNTYVKDKVSSKK
jgi:hypothetical protein